MKIVDGARGLKHQAFLRQRDLATLRAARQERRTRRDLFARVSASMEVPPLPAHRGAIWAIGMVRDEEDVLEATLRTLVEGGVDRILIVDNGSRDGTRDLLEHLRRDLPLTIGDDRLDAYEQSAKMTHLSDLVTTAGARWVIPFDADELWTGMDGTIAETLKAQRHPIITTDLVNIFPDAERPGHWRLDPQPHPDPKVAFRPFHRAVLSMGNHAVLRPGRAGTGLGVIHRPWRSFAQFARKTRQGAEAIAAADLPQDKGRHWRALGAQDDATLRRQWDDLLRGRADDAVAWYPRGGTVHWSDPSRADWGAVVRARESAS